jgi:hypothetical protein
MQHVEGRRKVLVVESWLLDWNELATRLGAARLRPHPIGLHRGFRPDDDDGAGFVQFGSDDVAKIITGDKTGIPPDRVGFGFEDAR